MLSLQLQKVSFLHLKLLPLFWGWLDALRPVSARFREGAGPLLVFCAGGSEAAVAARDIAELVSIRWFAELGCFAGAADYGE